MNNGFKNFFCLSYKSSTEIFYRLSSHKCLLGILKSYPIHDNEISASSSIFWIMFFKYMRMIWVIEMCTCDLWRRSGIRTVYSCPFPSESLTTSRTIRKVPNSYSVAWCSDRFGNSCPTKHSKVWLLTSSRNNNWPWYTEAFTIIQNSHFLA